MYFSKWSLEPPAPSGPKQTNNSEMGDLSQHIIYISKEDNCIPEIICYNMRKNV